jgi:hypothetical protein
VAVLLAVAVMPGSLAGAKTCGEERWDVKTLSDPKVDQVELSPIVKTTINDLIGNGKDRHCKGLPDERTFPEEFKVYEVEGILTFVAHEDDRDFHIALQDPDPPHRTMIVEVVDSACPGAKTSGQKDKLRDAREQFLDTVLGDGSMKDIVGTRVRVRGVGFFDFAHRQKGRSKTCIEWHPVLTIEPLP